MRYCYSSIEFLHSRKSVFFPCNTWAALPVSQCFPNSKAQEIWKQSNVASTSFIATNMHANCHLEENLLAQPVALNVQLQFPRNFQWPRYIAYTLRTRSPHALSWSNCKTGVVNPQSQVLCWSILTRKEPYKNISVADLYLLHYAQNGMRGPSISTC